MDDIAIRAENIAKCYRIGLRVDPRQTLGGALVSRLKSHFVNLRNHQPDSKDDDFKRGAIWALNSVSFEVRSGEAVGIIGRNGAGKSTLLKIISRITSPTSGRVEIVGRMSSLLEIGTGFHPDLTGRENVYLNGAIHGMYKREIDRKFDEIVAFAEIEPFVDTPIKRYSAGMRVRLAFAIAAHLEPEILLIDEVLAVGDIEFQKKCLGKMDDMSKGGRTLLFVSHNMAAVTSLCSRAIWLDGGRIVADGLARQIVDQYIADIGKRTETISLAERLDRQGSGEIKLVRMSFGQGGEVDSGYWISGKEASLDLLYATQNGQDYSGVEVNVGVNNAAGNPVLYLSSKVTGQLLSNVNGSGVFRCIIPRLPLEPGRYQLHTEVKHRGIRTDYVPSAAKVEVFTGDFYGTGVIPKYGGVLCDHAWSVDEIRIDRRTDAKWAAI